MPALIRTVSSIVPSTNTLTQLPNQFMDNGSVIQSNTTIRNALVQPVTNICISASNQQQNAVPTTSMTNETLYDFLNTTCTYSSSMLNFSRPSIAKSLALGVDPKIKAKIWVHEYVDLGTLLNSKFPQARFTMVEPYEGGMAWEKQKSLTYLFDSVAHWLSAFHIFVNIYCEKYPHEACSLMKYANTIQVLARRSCAVATFVYRNFRMWRERDYVNLPWDLVHSELHGDAIALGLKIKLEAMQKYPENQGIQKSPFLWGGLLRNKCVQFH